MFESGPLSEAMVGAFVLGCAMGIDHPNLILTILEQTHPTAVGEIIDECRAPMAEQVAAAKGASEPLEPEDFLDELIEALEQGEHVDEETAHNALSMSFEYGCVLAYLERTGAIMVRNAFNRSQQEAVEAFEASVSEELPDLDDVPAGPDPYQRVQDLAEEILEAYGADIGFG